MAVELPEPGNIFIPQVPDEITKQSPAVANYLRDFRESVQRAILGQFNNSFNIATAVNSGTSGTFTISSGGSIVVTSGIVINVTS